MILIPVLWILEHVLSQRFTCIKGDSRTRSSLGQSQTLWKAVNALRTDFSNEQTLGL